MYGSITSNWHFKVGDMIAPLILAVCIFALRRIIELVVTSMTRSLKFKDPTAHRKLPESVFLVLTYGSFWLWEAAIVFEYDFFLNPAGCFTNWSEVRLEKTPSSVNWLYVTVQGFYIQALFCCIMIGKFNFSATYS